MRGIKLKRQRESEVRRGKEREGWKLLYFTGQEVALRTKEQDSR